ncbi:hypothetical protein [Algoriphagus resistens]|uniref:hypothetical protein n=1 Tax=Algoriphagus resistens TaxID=1750590 RepID=UPI000A53C1BC|nr:hypothetical protein [Algoriphagus resistens]
MTLFKFYCAFAVLTPIALLLCKWMGLIGVAWGWVIALAILIPLLMALALVALAVYIIKTTPIEEWES